MTKAKVETLEKIISTMINSEFPEELPEEAVFDEKVEEIRKSLAGSYPVSDDEFTAIKRKLKANIVVKMELGVLIKDHDEHRPWLATRSESLDFFFWNRYKKYLEEVKCWNPRVIGNLGRVSDEIVDSLGAPAGDVPFQRRGLVLGDVQSGKTANYTAICNKAADTGYRVIIILTGTIENLRKQTQERLDAEFSGRKSQYFLDPKQEIENELVGVGRYGRDHEIATFTSVTKDFNINTLQALDLSLRKVESPVLFVIKKNKSVLETLIRWLKKNNLVDGKVIDLPLLLIDDEADNASVNTKKQDEDPTAINDAIRKLLKLFRKASYLGITATPYANIFIDPDTDTAMHGDDLFPRDFIYSLTPPTNYIGAESLFGEFAKFYDSLVELDSQEIMSFFPPDHTKDHVVDELPPSMKEAMAYFLLVNGIRDVRGDNSAHRSMMIHVSRFTNVQNQISDLAHGWIEDVRSDLQNFASLSEHESDKIKNIAFLKEVWMMHNLAERAGSVVDPMPWHDFLSKILFKAVSPIKVRTVNQKRKAALNYQQQKTEGLRVIAVGGNSLSRGLTLEGLCVSYFYRRTQMYDTLLQMGRWFGYRPGYDDLFKIWISREGIDWYGYITAATEELKLEIARMRDADQTPKEFGLKVRQDPNSLIVTARNKMRSATLVHRPITVSGRLLETPRLRADRASLRQNEEVFKDFVKVLPEIGREVEREGARYFWEDVAKEEVERLIRGFKTHPWHLAFQGSALADFIRGCRDMGDWDVVIPEGKANSIELDCGDEVIQIAPQSRIVKATKEQISISGTKVRVGAGGVAKLGLSKEQRVEAEEKFKKDCDKKQIPDSAYLKIKRNPLLMLHVIAVDRDKHDSQGKARTEIDTGCSVPDYLYALGIGIPDIGSERIAHYMVNMVELKNYFDAKEDEDV